MGDADDAELLTPSTYPRASRGTYPFLRRQTDASVCGEPGGSTGTLRVIYDRQFDRFFLCEDLSSSSVQSVPAKSPKPRRARVKTSTVNKRPSAVSVQWEDLILPPRSVTKRSGTIGDVSFAYSGLSEDAGNGDKPDTCALDNPAAVSQPLNVQAAGKLQPAVREPSMSQPQEALADPGIPAQGSAAPSDVTRHDGDARPESVPLANPGELNLDSTHEETPPIEKTVRIEPPITDQTVVSRVEDSIQLATTGSTAMRQPVEPPVPAAETSSEVSGENAVSCAVSLHPPESTAVHLQPVEGPVATPEPPSNGSDAKFSIDGAAGAIAELPAENSESAPQESQFTSSPSKCTAIVRLVRILRRYIRKQRALPQLPAPVQPTVLRVGSEISIPAAVREKVMIPPCLDRGTDQTPVFQDNAAVVALHLDLSKLTVLASSQQHNPTSPMRKSPKKKKARVPSYTRHFQDATAAATSAIHGSSLLRVNSEHDHDVRWQGDVVHVNVPIRTNANDDWGSIPSRDAVSTQPYREQRPLLGHVYSLRALARIRPHADGFRRVNEACTFTPLTSSSSESSESEDEQIAVVHIPFSSDDEHDETVVFQRGDKVLFHARHRWFHGTILKRIKSSWFYDIRAANGSVFEAVQAKRIRRFDGHDDDAPTFSFAIRDRVLWRPRDATHQTYKARIVSIRRCSSRASSSHGHPSKRYDLELLTGRVVTKIPHDELRPLRSGHC